MANQSASHHVSHQHKSELINITKSNQLKLPSQNIKGELRLSGFYNLLHKNTLLLDPLTA